MIRKYYIAGLAAITAAGLAGTTVTAEVTAERLESANSESEIDENGDQKIKIYDKNESEESFSI